MNAAPSPRRTLVEAAEVARMLNAQAESLCRQILPDGRRVGHEWVARAPWRSDAKEGSFSVHLSGGKAGLWADFADSAAKGDALDLVSWVCCGRDKKTAFQWSLRYLGLDSGDPAALETARRAAPPAEAVDAMAAAEAEEARMSARRVWFAGDPKILGTPVDAYLAGRGIALAEMGRAPGSIRFHRELWNVESKRHWPAMVTAISSLTTQGGFYACHRTWLEVLADGRVRKAPLEKNKMVLGAYRGGHIALWRGKSGKPFRDATDEILDISEGVEDGLSVAYAMPDCRVIASVSLSNMASIELPPAIRTVRLWRQNDNKIPALAAFDRAVRAHLGAGRMVWLPPIPPDLKDVNDLLVQLVDEVSV